MYAKLDIINHKGAGMMQLRAEQRILFIGDSITDSGRDYDNEYDLGQGFAHIAGSMILGKYPELNLQVLNRGVNGNRLSDLASRWQRDCLDLKPDSVTLLIGVNDIWHNRTAGRQLTESDLAEFNDTYRKLLSALRDRNPQVQLVLLQPFILPVSTDRLKWRHELKQINKLIEAIAIEFEADYTRLDDRFMHLTKVIPPQNLTGDDGIHPTRVGHGVIANMWLENAKVLKA